MGRTPALVYRISDGDVTRRSLDTGIDASAQEWGGGLSSCHDERGKIQGNGLVLAIMCNNCD
jgi:hypothetical protein